MGMKKLLKVLPFFVLLIFMFFSAKQTYADSAPIVPVGNNFLQLQTKIDEASGTTQIQLTSDIELHQTIEIVAGKDIILDLNGHTVSSSSQFTTSAEFYVASDAKMTLIDSSAEKTGLIVQTTRPQAVWVNGEFVMNGGCISGSDNYNAQVIHLAGDNAKFTMNGGTITGNKKAKKAIFFAGGGSTFIMNGGVIKEFIGDDGCVVKSTDSSVQVKLLGGEIKDNISPHGCVYVMTESGNFVIGNGMEIWDNYNPEKTTNANVLINGIYKVKVENPSADMMFGVSFIGNPALGTITADADFLTSDTDKSAIPLEAIFADDPKFYFDSTTGKYTSKTPLVEGEVDFLCYANLKCVVASAPIAYANKSKTYKWQISSDEGNRKNIMNCVDCFVNDKCSFK